MKINNLASSSKGNCTHIYTDNASILIDVGISMKKIKSLVGHLDFDAIFITHEHGDHIGGAGPIGRKTNTPIFVHKDSYEKFSSKLNKCNINFLELIDSGEPKYYNVGDLTITPFSTPHDSAYSVGYTIKDETTNKKLGYLTDCGHYTKTIEVHLKNCDAYMIETDYNEEKLASCDIYDEFLKDRIRSNFGHLSNKQTLDFLKKLKITESEFIMFCHLSQETNSPEIVLNEAKEAFPNYNNFLIAPPNKILEL